MAKRKVRVGPYEVDAGAVMTTIGPISLMSDDIIDIAKMVRASRRKDSNRTLEKLSRIKLRREAMEYSGLLSAARGAVAEVATRLGIEPDLLLGRTRLGPVARARAVCAWMLVKVWGLALEEAGIVLDGRDHSTIINLVNAADSEWDIHGAPRRIARIASEVFHERKPRMVQ